MSSSARRKPSWSTPKNSVKTHISTVYAEPEQSIRTISAQHVIVSAQDTLSLYSNDSRRPSVASLRIPSPEPLEEMDQPITPQSHDPNDNHPSTTPPTSTLPQPSITALQLNHNPQLPSPPVQKSWFAVLSRPNPKMEPQHQPTVVLDEVTIHHTSTTPAPLSPVKKAVSAIPDHRSSNTSTTDKDSLPSSIDEQVPILDITTTIPPPPPVTVSVSNETKPSALNSSTSRFTLSIPLLGRAKIPLDGVLGAKNKDKLEDRLQPVTILPEADPSSPQPITTNHVIDAAVMSDSLAHISQNVESTAEDQPFPLEEPASLTSDPSGSVDLPTQSTESQARMAANDSWWSYLGWTSIPVDSSNTDPASIHVSTELRHCNSPAINPNPLLSAHSSAPVDSNPVEASSGSAATPTSGVSRTPESQCHAKDVNQVTSSGSTETAIVNSDNSNVNMSSNASETNTSHSLPSEGKADQVLEQREQLASAEQQPNTTDSTASWFSPWSWYSHSYDPTLTANVTQDDGKQGGNENAIVDADGGKEEEPAGPQGIGNSNINETGCRAGMEDEVQMQHHHTEADVPVVSEEANPIQQSISANRSGWASFFSSRTLFVKSIGYGSVDEDTTKRDENGMEVMDIDFDDDIDSNVGGGGGTSVNATTSDTETVGSKGKGRNTTNITTQDQPTAPPLTNNEKIKKETVKSNPANQTPTKSQSNKSVSGIPTPVPGASTPTSIPTNKQSSVPASPIDKAPTINISVGQTKRTASPAPSSQSKKNAIPPPPNLVLPTWEDTFCVSPRSDVLPEWVKSIPGSIVTRNQQSSTAGAKLFGKTMKFVSGVLFSKEGDRGKEVVNDEREQLDPAERERFLQFGKGLPRAWDVVQGHFGTETSGHSLKRRLSLYKDGGTDRSGPSNHIHDVLQGCRRVVVIGIHGWFPGAVVRTVLGEPTGTSSKFVSMMVQALQNFELEYGVTLDKITTIPLEGEGTIEKRVERLYRSLSENQEWMDDLHAADAIFVATHSQGSVVSTHLLDRLIRDRYIRTTKNSEVLSPATSFPASAGMSVAPAPRPQKVCCLALCGIHLGPLRYLSSNSLFQPYFQYFESSAARELFEFQNTESAVSKSYVKALRHVVDNGVKMVYVASLNDQVVPIYSGLFTSVSHPLILRALYIDGDAYHSSDFLSNLLVLLLRLRNSGINDSGLLTHLSEATAGSLNGIGHSTAYEELATYSLAVKYLFLTNDGFDDHPDLTLEPFNANHEQNDYEIPWALRDIIANESVTHFFATEIAELRDAFRDWHPKTTILRDLKKKLQPIQRLSSSFSSRGSNSKL